MRIVRLLPKVIQMTIYVNAWLDCDKPRVTVKDKISGRTIARFNTQEVTDMFDRGDVCLEDFYRSDTPSKIELIKTLLLISCTKSLKKQLDGMHKSIAKRLQVGLPSTLLELPV